MAKKVITRRTLPDPPTQPALTAESVGRAVAGVVVPLLTDLSENMTRLTNAVQQGQTDSSRPAVADAIRNHPSGLERILKGTIALFGMLFLFLVIHHIQGCSQNGDILKGVGNLQASYRASEATTEERHQEVLEAIQSRPASDLSSAVVDDTPKVSKIPSAPPPEEAKERKETEAPPSPEVTVSRPPAPPPAYTVPEKSGLAGSGREVGAFRPQPDQCRDRKPLVVEHHHHHHYSGEILVVVEDRRSP